MDKFIRREEKNIDRYGERILEVILDISLGIILGILVDTISNLLGKVFGLGFIGVIIIQIFLIANVLHFVKEYFDVHLCSWQGRNDYGIVFVAIFLAVQRNLTHFLSHVGKF